MKLVIKLSVQFGKYGSKKGRMKPSAAMQQTLNPHASIDYVTQHLMSVFSCNDTVTRTSIRLRVRNKVMSLAISVLLSSDLQVNYRSNMNINSSL